MTHSVSTDVLDGIVNRLATAAQTGTPTTPVRNELEAGGIDAAYAIKRASSKDASHIELSRLFHLYLPML